MKLIDKDTLVAEIEKRLKKYAALDVGNSEELEAIYGAECKALIDILKFLDTLEAKEVDLEKELDNWRHNHFHGRRDKEASGEYLERSSQFDIAKHFFELGLKAQKGE